MRRLVAGALVLASIVLAAPGAGTQALAGEPSIPFPETLDAAAVAVERLDDVLEHALIIGNGDINALVCTDSGNLLLRLSKNDVWDARLDTSEDPPLLPMARIRELAKGDWLKAGAFGGGWLGPDGTPHRGGNSWSRPYPCPRPCGVVRLGARPSRPVWRQIRREGAHNAWERKGNATVMSIQGRKGASNGYALGPLDLSTADYPTLRVALSGTENARFFIDLMDPANLPVFSSKWIETPTEAEARTFELPAGKPIAGIILYTWTEDGKRAENRFEEVVFEGPKGRLPIDLADLSAIQAASSPARLDIRRAVAAVAGAPDGVPRAEIRALAQRNAFLIRSTAAAQLVPPQSSVIPAATTGERDGVAWLTQTIPGDPDWPGMSFAVALAAEGERKAVAIVTSHESKDVVADAVKLAASTLAADAAQLVRDHEAEWQRFWAASGVDLDDGFLSSTWYRNLYFLRCVSKPGVQCVGLYAGLIHDGMPPWHGGHTTNYNAEQTFWSSFATNHTELNEPYEQLVSEYLPRARWLCRQLFDCEGAYFPHNLFNFEPPHPEKCKSRIGRQQFYVTWSYTIGVSGFTVQNLWLRYKYQPDRDYLERIAYPAVRDVATFYANYIDQCEEAEGGKVLLAPSVSPEHWGWTHNLLRNRNGTFDIAFARYTMQAAIEGATTLGRDTELAARLRKAIERLPDYPTTGGDEPIVVDVQDAPPINYNIAVPVVPVFPADVVTWFAAEPEKTLFARTVERVRWNGYNSSIIVPIARARLSLPGTWEFLKREMQARSRPNGTITLRAGDRCGHFTEQFAAAAAVSELLLQSVGDIIRVFPAWPKDKDARFRDLRAQGGFLVSAAQQGSTTGPIAVTSTAGGKLRLLCPWPGASVQSGDGKLGVLRTDARGVVELDTTPGQRLLLRPPSGPPPRQ